MIIFVDIQSIQLQRRARDGPCHDDIVHPDETEFSASSDNTNQGLQKSIVESPNTAITIPCNMKQFATLESFSDSPNGPRCFSDVTSTYNQTLSDSALTLHALNTMSPSYQNSEGSSLRSSLSSTPGSNFN